MHAGALNAQSGGSGSGVRCGRFGFMAFAVTFGHRQRRLAGPVRANAPFPAAHDQMPGGLRDEQGAKGRFRAATATR